MDQPIVQERLAPPTRATAWSTVVLSLVIGLCIIGAVFLREIRSAIEVWNASTAYSHCYLVLPMAIYLLWERRTILQIAAAKPDLRFAFAGIPLTLFWLLAERLGIMEARQLAFIAGVQLLFLTVLGARLYKAISGPLMYLFFLVPFGAFLTPFLQKFTAGFTIVGLDLLGIPNFSDKFTIETPAGVFFVAEACAGLRFLIAAVAFGVFYALLSYKSLTRRIAFIAASIIVPIVANGFRALGIVVLGQILGSAEAAAADHLIYGWVFFSAVMLLLIASGHMFRQEGDVAHLQNASSAGRKWSPIWCVACVVGMLGFGPMVAGAIASTSTSPVMAKTDPFAIPPECSLDAEVADTTDRRVTAIVCGRTRYELAVQLFAARSTASSLLAMRRNITQEIGAEDAAAFGAELPADNGSWTIVQTTDPNRVTGYASWVDGTPVSSGLAGRVAQARDSILGSDYTPALITLTTAEAKNSTPAQRKQTLEQLMTLLQAQSDLNARMSKLTRLQR